MVAKMDEAGFGNCRNYENVRCLSQRDSPDIAKMNLTMRLLREKSGI